MREGRRATEGEVREGGVRRIRRRREGVKEGEGGAGFRLVPSGVQAGG